MANTSALMASYDFGFAAGSVNREDLSDVIINIAPFETPLFSTAPRVPVRHTTHEWLEDSLAAASTTPYSGSYATEGADFAAQVGLVPARLTNWTQIFRKDIKVSETQRVLNPAGMRDLYQYQIEIAMKEIARHIETKFFDVNSGTAASATGATGTLRQMSPIGLFVTANTGSGSGASGHAKTAIDALIEKCFIAGGSPTKIFCHPNSKTQFASALGGTGFQYRNIAASDARVIGNIDVYTSNFNVIELIPDRFVPSGSATAAATGASG